MKEYHIVFETLACRRLFVGDVAIAVGKYITNRFASSGVSVLAMAVLPEHIHILLRGIRRRRQWNTLLCSLQMELSTMLRQEFPDLRWPKYIWVYNWWFRRIYGQKHHVDAKNYILRQRPL